METTTHYDLGGELCEAACQMMFAATDLAGETRQGQRELFQDCANVLQRHAKRKALEIHDTVLSQISADEANAERAGQKPAPKTTAFFAIRP